MSIHILISCLLQTKQAAYLGTVQSLGSRCVRSYSQCPTKICRQMHILVILPACNCISVVQYIIPLQPLYANKCSDTNFLHPIMQKRSYEWRALSKFPSSPKTSQNKVTEPMPWPLGLACTGRCEFVGSLTAVSTTSYRKLRVFWIGSIDKTKHRISFPWCQEDGAFHMQQVGTLPIRKSLTWSWNVGALQPSSRLDSTLHLQERLWGRRTWAVSHIHFWKVNPNASKCHLYDNDSNSCLTAVKSECPTALKSGPFNCMFFTFTRTCTATSIHVDHWPLALNTMIHPPRRAHTHMLYTHTKQFFRSVSVCWGLKAPSSMCSCEIRKALGTSVVCCILCLVIIRLCTTRKLRKLCDSCRNLVNLVQLRIWGHISSWHISYLQRKKWNLLDWRDVAAALNC